MLKIYGIICIFVLFVLLVYMYYLYYLYICMFVYVYAILIYLYMLNLKIIKCKHLLNTQPPPPAIIFDTEFEDVKWGDPGDRQIMIK